MTLYIYIILLALFSLQLISVGIIAGKLGEERGKYRSSDLYGALISTVLFAIAVIQATGIYWRQ